MLAFIHCSLAPFVPILDGLHDPRCLFDASRIVLRLHTAKKKPDPRCPRCFAHARITRAREIFKGIFFLSRTYVNHLGHLGSYVIRARIRHKTILDAS